MIRVSQQGDGATPLVLGNIRAPRNGYAYVYVSNERNEPVFFDDLKVQHRRSALLEETHYYPFGLTMAGISSKKLGDINEGRLKNQYLYQGAYAEYEDETSWNDFELRSYDAQIGRFIQADPYDQFASPYTGMGNDPVNLVDPSGGWSEPIRGVGVVLANAATSSSSSLLSTLSTIASIATGAINVAGTIANQQTVISQGRQGPGLPKTYKQGDQIQVNQGGKNVGTIDVSTFSNTSSNKRGSVKIELRFKNKRSKLKNFNWIQTVRSNFSIGSNINKATEINDPDPPDDNKPFYWTDAEAPTENKSPGYDARFYDEPKRGVRANQGLYWRGELSLVGQGSDGSYSSLITLSYGFQIDKTGKITIQNIRSIPPSKFQNLSIKKAK